MVAILYGMIQMMNTFESFQKKCIKWILSEEENPTLMRFILVHVSKLICLPYPLGLNSMILISFIKSCLKNLPVNIPDYLTHYSGDSRLRRTHLDNLSFVSNIASTTTTSIKNIN